MNIIKEIERIRETLEESFRQLDELIEQLTEMRNTLKAELERKLEQFQLTNYDLERLSEFLEEPYCILPKGKDAFWVVVPKFVNFHVGWLEHETRSYYIFAINRYMQWITPLPKKLKEKLKFPEMPPFKVFDGILLTGKEHQQEAWKRYRQFLSKREGEDRIRIKRGYEFQLIAKLIEDGILPFIPQPVEEDDLRDWNGLELRDYQRRAWEEFLRRGAVGIYWAFGAGKSLFGLYALARIKGSKLVVVPYLTTKEQWMERIDRYIPEFKDEITIITYRGFEKVKNEKYTLCIFDEVHHLPAPSYIPLSTLRRKYTIGLSGSPFREDGHEPYIFALTGYPIGLSWDELLEKRIVKKPAFRIYIVSNRDAKLKKLGELLKIPVKTLIFCDSIEFGKKISKKFGIPFVYSETRRRLDIIKQAQHCIVSRVGDEGLSLPDLERVIEVDFLKGSRMQESQRFGRLMHAAGEEPEHIVIATEEEFEKYHKRFYAITERGFSIEIVR